MKYTLSLIGTYLIAALLFSACQLPQANTGEGSDTSSDSSADIDPGADTLEPIAIPETESVSFEEDLQVLTDHKKVILLKGDGDKDQVAIVADYQGRVMTSTATGMSGISQGWVNGDFIKSGEVKDRMNPFGGEDRFWLGPEAGQYALFFEKGEEFIGEDWNVPPAFDIFPFDVVSTTDTEAAFRKLVKLSNYQGTAFDMEIRRKISLLSQADAETALGYRLPDGAEMVAFQSDNQVKNVGSNAWTKDKGLVSIWILGMFPATDYAVGVFPLAGENPKVATNYFQPLDESRFKLENNTAYFRIDGKFASKIGVAPAYTKPIMASYDAGKRSLTIVQFSFEGEDDYVNSLWEIQDEPYKGDVLNSYNNGSSLEKKEFFYELESSSPALALAPEASASHMHRTFHIVGEEALLDEVSKAVLGVGIERIKHAFFAE